MWETEWHCHSRECQSKFDTEPTETFQHLQKNHKNLWADAPIEIRFPALNLHYFAIPISFSNTQFPEIAADRANHGDASGGNDNRSSIYQSCKRASRHARMASRPSSPGPLISSTHFQFEPLLFLPLINPILLLIRK